MKLVKFAYNTGIHWGVLDKNNTTLHTDLSKTPALKDFNSVMDFFEGYPHATQLPDLISLLDVTRLAPVLPTKNVLCIGKNYHDHILEFDGSAEDIEKIKENPIFFSKAISSIIATNTLINPHTNITSQVDYEAELGVIIGKACLNVTEEEALDYVYGYTCINDVTARDIQKRHQQWMRGKSLDTHCPIGPCLVTADEIGDPQNLKIRSIINGDLRQDANTSLMMHSVAAQISVLSQGMTLNPGDIIATGTPKGVGMGFNPPKFLKPGDEVEIYIEKIGSLINVVGQ